MRQYRLQLEYQDRFSYSWGYAIYSAFLAELNEELADAVHGDVFFTQYMTPEEWVVNTTAPFDFKESYHLHRFGADIRLIEQEISTITEQELADKFLIKEPYQKTIRLRFLTPTTFKQDGEYVLYPTVELIMQSLTNKWNVWAKSFLLEDIQWDNCQISRYNLRSALYFLKGIRIRGFVGYVDLRFWGPESMIRLANMICNFAQYSGIGIKSTLGMGGVGIGK
ncbi:MAG: CRISPR system precrRNA processing endoribonuclease RAMP protein Cas6 [Clostridia bacterium]|nr:CRISPR system precrRNA processing endoribonuclease RAMP protein Cas6 [Clostridia bacterium]